MDYFCSDNACGGTSDQCRLKTCEGNTQAPGVANKKCKAGKVLIGFNSAGQTICCRPGEQWDETSSPPQCKCPTGKTWNGFKCACPQDHREKLDGSCVEACKSSGVIKRVWTGFSCICPFTTISGTNWRCECPRSRAVYNLGDIVHPYWDTDHQRCQCPQNNVRKYFNGMRCTTCPHGQHRIGDSDTLGEAPDPEACKVYRSGWRDPSPGHYINCGSSYTDPDHDGDGLGDDFDRYDPETKSCWSNPLFKK